MDKQKLHVYGTKTHKLYLKREDSRRVMLILVFLFQINLYELNMYMIVYYGISPRDILRRYLSHLEIMELNVIGDFQGEKVFHNF